MKSILINGLALGAVIVLSACGTSSPGNQDAYQTNSSNCSAMFVFDHNMVALDVKYARSMSSVEQAERKINEFSSKYAGVVCKAELKEEGSLISTPATIDANAKVAQWKSLMASVRSASAKPSSAVLPTLPALPPVPVAPVLPTSPIAPIDPSRMVSVKSFTNGITFEIVDGGLFNRAVNDGANNLFQNGKATPEYLSVPSLDFCFVEMKSGKMAAYRSGEKVTFTVYSVGTKLIGLTPNQEISFGCGKAQGATSTSWTLRDLDTIFGATVAIVGNP